MEYSIASQWNGEKIDHVPVNLKLNAVDEDFVSIEVDAPFFDDPEPQGPAGKPFPQLWDYEVVEAFFLGKDDKYLEIELSPHGQHLVLLLNGRRNMIKDKLPLEYCSKIDKEKKRWTGKATIPSSYFPAFVSKFNAYAIHGVDEKRIYEALYPAEKEKHSQPDFHHLEYFQSINISSILIHNKEESVIWKEAL